MQLAFFRKLLSGCGLFVWLCLFQPLAYAVNYGENLIKNGGAEAIPGFSPVPGWNITGAFTVVAYGASGGFPGPSPSPGTPGPPDQGTPSNKNFFAGGNASISTATQEIDLTANAADINAGNVSYDLSGWLGGFSTDGDN